ncbi:AMP-dependent synthetase/ligase [Kutzneria sp. NPDC052558]|uniref:AMP-dependent synthetase/ligase n=1 Tax=Kutzneria sp. NPDC052558 TaxID=3364121 RepID=UPI0037C51E6C
MRETVNSIAEAFQTTASRRPDDVALRTPGDGVTITWREYGRRVRAIATGLASLGVRRGDTVALMMTNRPEFHLVDAAAFHLGATPFSVYNTSSPEQIRFLFGSAEPKVVVCEEQFAAKVFGPHVVCVDGHPAGTTTLAELESASAPGFDFEATWRAVQPDDVLTLIYTSGTTGDPKGVQITHANVLAEIAGVNTVLRVGPGDRTLSFLPSAHIADRVGGHYLQAVCGTQVTTVADRHDVMAALLDTRPTNFGTVPQMWHNVRAGIEAAAASRREEFQQALEIGRRHVRARQAGEVPPELDKEYQGVDEAVFAPLRALLGLDQARVVQSGAAPISAELVEFFNAIGIPLSDIWGMSELTCVAALAPHGELRIGAVGKPLPGVEIRVADDGELLVRGPIVMKGYLGRPDLTAEAIDPDGWLHTGDIGSIDEDGYVRVLDRKKELIINAHGKNMSPANIEKAVKDRSALIAQVVAIGDNRPYNVGLVVLDPDAAARRGLPADPALLAAHPEVQALVADAVDAANQTLSRVEQLKKFLILPTHWEPGSELLTHTMKLRRRPIAARYAAEIESLYAR